MNRDILFLVIYDNEVSENLVKTLARILKDRKNITVYFSVEKRYLVIFAGLVSSSIFLNDENTIALCCRYVFTRLNKKIEAIHYEYFFNLLNNFLQVSLIEFELRQITDVPQYFYEYERLKETELWCIFRNK